MCWFCAIWHLVLLFCMLKYKSKRYGFTNYLFTTICPVNAVTYYHSLADSFFIHATWEQKHLLFPHNYNRARQLERLEQRRGINILFYWQLQKFRMPNFKIWQNRAEAVLRALALIIWALKKAIGDRKSNTQLW